MLSGSRAQFLVDVKMELIFLSVKDEFSNELLSL